MTPSTASAPAPSRFAVPPFALPASRAERSAHPAAWPMHAVRPYVPQPWRAETRAAAPDELFAVEDAPPLTLSAVPSLAPTPIMPMAAIPTPDDTVRADAHEPGAASLADDGELPWIDQFLSSTPVAPMEAIQGPPDAFRYSTPAASMAIPFGGIPPYVPPVAPALATPAGVDAAAADADSPAVDAEAVAANDAWPLEEAAGALDSIARELGDDAGYGSSPARLFGNVATPVPLPAWADDDLMNIMPVRVATPARAQAVGESAAVQGTTEPPHQATGAAQADASALAAAQALEMLAQRVRAGELQLPGYDPRMGDAAALVSALAALLGLRLG